MNMTYDRDIQRIYGVLIITYSQRAQLLWENIKSYAYALYILQNFQTLKLQRFILVFTIYILNIPQLLKSCGLFY